MEYLTLFQTLEKLKGIPEPYQPHGIAQLANACMKDKIIPVFQYNAYALKYVSGTGEYAEYIIIPIRGYLTHKNLSNVFDWSNRRDKKIEFTEATIYELTQKEELLYENNTILLAKKTFHNLSPFGNAKSVLFDVNLTGHTKLYSSSNEKDAEKIRELGGIEISQSDLLFPTTQVESYIDSFICEYEESHISLLMDSPTVANDESQESKQIIIDLRDQVTQLINDNASLKKQLTQQAAAPADDVDLNPKTLSAVTRLLNVLFHKAQLDITAHKGTTNKNIVSSSINLNAKITEKPVSHWIKQVQQLRIDTQDRNH